MPLHGALLYASDFNARASDAEFRAGLALWWASWQQLPAASLPDDEVVLCKLADLGRDLKGFRKVRAVAMHNFVLCSDGRWYHRFLAGEAAIAWDKRAAERERKRKYREAKSGREAESGHFGDGDNHGLSASCDADAHPMSPSPSASQDADVPAEWNRRDGKLVGRDTAPTPANHHSETARDTISDDLFPKVCAAGGYRPKPSMEPKDRATLDGWLAGGADESSILGAVRGHLVTHPGSTNSLARFTAAVTDWQARIDAAFPKQRVSRLRGSISDLETIKRELVQ